MCVSKPERCKVHYISRTHPATHHTRGQNPPNIFTRRRGGWGQGCNATRIMSRITRIILLIILVILLIILVILLIILVAYHPWFGRWLRERTGKGGGLGPGRGNGPFREGSGSEPRGRSQLGQRGTISGAGGHREPYKEGLGGVFCIS